VLVRYAHAQTRANSASQVKRMLEIEPPLDCRRLNSLRGYGHRQRNQVFTRGTGTGSSPRRGAA